MITSRFLFPTIFHLDKASSMLQVTPLPKLHETKEAATALYKKELNSTAEDGNEGFVYFVLEESSGCMEPSLHFLAVAHTFISFCCIIGYYCLKVF